MARETSNPQMKVSILISTFGSQDWSGLAWSRAHPSAILQDSHEVLVAHEPEATIAEVRNANAARATGDFLCNLDADDELGPGFIEAMRRAWEQERGDDETPLLLTPAVSFVLRGRKYRQHFSPEIEVREGNWLIIGTLLPRSLFTKIGGFKEWPLYEDWDLWTRCVQAGARIVKVPDALYLAHVTRSSRNRVPNRQERNYWHQRIGHSNWPNYYDSTSEDEDIQQRSWGVRKLQTV